MTSPFRQIYGVICFSVLQVLQVLQAKQQYDYKYNIHFLPVTPALFSRCYRCYKTLLGMLLDYDGRAMLAACAAP